MIKQLALTALMLIMIPAFAFAGSYSIAVSGSGGSLATAPFSGYATAAKSFTATAAVTYTLSSVTRNGVDVTKNATYVTGSGPWTVAVPLSNASQTFYVFFKQNVQVTPTLTALLPASITIPVGTPTLISGASSTIANLQTGTQATFTFSGAGLTFSPASALVTNPINISTQVSAAAAGTFTATLTLTAPGATPSSTNVIITVQPPGVVASNFCLSCHNGWDEANKYAGSGHAASVNGPSCQSCHNPGLALQHPGYSTSDKTANPGLFYSCVTCHFPGSTIVSSWPPNGLTFHNAYTGTNQCVNCHNPHNPGIVTGISGFPHFSTYSTAQFVTKNISCNNCHTSLVDNSFNIFPANLEYATSGHGNPFSPAYIGPGPYTEANLEAADYKFLGTPLPATPATTVSNDCVRCHTTTGFINYITPTNPLDPQTAFQDIHAWGTPGDRTREMVVCNACHNNTTGFDAAFSRRTVGIIENTNFTNVVQAWYNYSSATTKKIIRSKQFTNQSGNEYTDSNICIACHSGKVAGNVIKQTTANPAVCTSATLLPSIVCRLGNGTVSTGLTHAFWSNVDFIDPHGMSAANIMIPDNLRAGYEYRPNSATTTNHSDISTDSSQGPCVACHMSSPKKHVFSPISTASNGVITAITTTLCSNCHGGSGPAFTISSPVDLETRRVGYQAALSVITAQLAAKGVFFNTALPPYFFTTSNTALQNNSTRVTNWNAPASLIGGQGANLMGAAFNLRLLSTDAGWVHNGTTSKRLLYDTIDYLDDGIPTNNTVAATIQNLAGIDLTTKNSATSYIGTRP